MKKVIERMNNSVVAQQLAQQTASGKGASGSAAGAGTKKSKWLFRRASGKDAPQTATPEGEEEVEGMRVDFYLVVFLKFIASIVPTIEVDSTTAM
jgi:ubiquitin-like-conjugating enzyme ATG3